ncbi:MAG TPA: alanine--tRNA ligase [Bavariicoccus seileri]|uniref:Alanine--tRNA ligase n=1 Tax=Bavariicoccus seileri TaxID=549685 RepID=A0A3D4S719_9ENTE|nr:alanine--tRNA ligase [Bavariicoccus seileri]HCS93751.1 alanine--tRNA ligase [Bavariicoccus seileri]
MLSSQEIRQRYLNYFKKLGHKVQPSASLIPINDPSLLWINSGVATMKRYFDGTETPENPRITSSQKSIRTNDIENVGYTARHHTLFEMLGNFSIGDYFKKEVIPWAWDFLTSKEEGLGLDPGKLYVTYYPEDEETKEIWIKTGVPESHIVPVEDNFWDIGQGPCGPDSEIFFDRGPEFQDLAEDDPENYPGGENERYLEIWNLVFSEFNHKSDGTYVPLPHKNVDTGMGLERVVSVLQNAPTNFETDLFLPIIQAVEAQSPIKYGESKNTDVSFKVIADHIRAVTFAIGDGALPSNEGRGYIIRRLIRRSVMHGQRLGIKDSFLSGLVKVVVKIMSGYYPELKESESFIEKVIRNEEDRFHETLNDGLTILNEKLALLKNTDKTMLSGEDAFQLYDTYGFPLELTIEYAKDEGFSVDNEGFETAMKEQQERARAARNVDASMHEQSNTLRYITVPSQFVGYSETTDHGVLKTIVSGDKLVDKADASDEVQLVFDQTPFYAEMGGQIADTGVIGSEDGTPVGRVTNVQHAPNGQNLHTVILEKKIEVGKTYVLVVDELRRRRIENNHTATHLLHQALKDVLGKHANQAGSLVAPDYLRFDFSHFGQVTDQEINQMEEIVNEKIWEAIPVLTHETTLEKAKKMGAMALFGEKYGHDVRVVDVDNWSLELCGGTHVKNTADLGLFKIVSESGIGAGVRRIEAVTSKEAYRYLTDRVELLKQVAVSLKAPTVDAVPQRLEQLKTSQKELNSALESLKAKAIHQAAETLMDQATTVGSYSLISAELPNKSIDELRTLADEWRQKKASDVLILGTSVGDKVNLLVAVSDETVKKGIKAGVLIKAISPAINGGGGGRPTLAQAGGSNPSGIKNAFDIAKKWLSDQK